MSELLPDDPSLPPPGEPAPRRTIKSHQILLSFLAVILVVWLLSGFYQVGANQIAIVERLGEYLSNTDHKIIELKAGLHYHLPWPVDIVHFVSTTETLTLNVTEFNDSPAAYAAMKDDLRKQNWDPAIVNAIFDPYLITADKSIVNMQIKASYVISDASLWLTTVSHESDEAGEPNDMRAQLFASLAQRAMIHQTSQMNLDDLLFNKRAQLPQDLLATVRQDFEISDITDPTGAKTIDLGINIQKVDIAELHPPSAVAGAYDQVSNARQHRVATSNEAEGYATQQKLRAGADADSMILDAQAYKNTRLENARGEHDQFTAILERFHADPSGTRARIFTDAVTIISKAAKQIFIAQPGQRTILTIPPPKYDAGQAQTNP